jgi:ferredoxin
VKISIDASRCTGHGRCYTLAPSVYGCDDEGYNDARGQTITVTPGEETAAQIGLDACPERAITVVEP